MEQLTIDRAGRSEPFLSEVHVSCGAKSVGGVFSAIRSPTDIDLASAQVPDLERALYPAHYVFDLIE